jgi:hypothetical protein
MPYFVTLEPTPNEQVALHAFARHIGPAHLRPLAGDLVDLVEEDDTEVFDAVERVGGHVLDVDQLVQLLLEQNAPSFGDLDRALFLALGHPLL